MDKPLMSIIIPVYNVEKYLKQCLDSVIAQKYNNYEIILVDDGSTDDSPNICNEYADKYQNIRCFHKENGGLSSARNYGVDRMNGEYVLFLDSDDYWDDSEFLYKISNILKKEDYDIIVFGMKKYFEDSKCFCNPQFKFDNNTSIYELIKYNKFKASACNKIIKSEILKKNNIVFPLGLKSEDIKWTYEVLKNSKNIYALKENIYVYRQRGGSITKTIKEQNILDMISMFKFCYEDCIKCNNSNKEVLLSYIAYEYCVALGLVSCIKNVQKSTKHCLYDMKYFLKYRISKKVKLVHFCKCIFGIRITSRLLGIFILKKGN